MAFRTPELNELKNSIKKQIEIDYNTTAPQDKKLAFQRFSFANILVSVIAFAFYGLYKSLIWLYQNAFLSTAFDETEILKHAEINGLTQKGSTGSSGFVVFSGALNSVAPVDSILTNQSGVQFQTKQEGVITQKTIPIASLSRVGDVVYATTTATHNLASGLEVVISGANEGDFNGTFLIVATGATTFTYEASGTQGLASGAINTTVNTALVEVYSLSSGLETNLASGDELTLDSPILGLNSTAYVDANGLSGGVDAETLDELKARTLDYIQNPVPVESPGFYANLAKSINGIQNAWCIPPQTAIQAGNIYIYIQPYTPQNITNLTNKILDGNLNAGLYNGNINILEPVEKLVNITITGLTPNNQSMQNAINANLQDLFNKTTLGITISSAEIENTIRLTLDSNNTRPIFTSLNISDLTTDINTLLTLGNISYNYA